MTERTAADYAIEHAEYLAQAVEHYMAARNELDAALEDIDDALDLESAPNLYAFEEAVSEHFNGLRSAIYEFRKRAERAKAPSPLEGSGNG